MKLSDICRIAAEGQGLLTSDLLDTIAVIRGSDYWEHAKPGFLYQPGRPPELLSPEMEFKDSFMRLEHIGHYPMTVLFFHETEAHLVEALLGDSSVFNNFTSFAIAFRNGRKSPFVCYYRALDGTEQVFNPDHILGFGYEFSNRRL